MGNMKGFMAAGGVAAAFQLISSAPLQAAGFALMEQSASGQGTAFAGGAAVAEDASVIFFNPAGMTRLTGRQLVLGGSTIKLRTDFANSASSYSSASGGGAIAGVNDDGGTTAFVPTLYFSTRVNDRLSTGIGVNIPFGLETNYADNWIGRYHGIKSEVATINVNPSLAYKINDRFSVGGGLDVQYIDATLTSAIDFGALLGAPGTLDGKASVTGDDTSFGYNIGLLFSPTPQSQIGLSYRSSIRHTLTGGADFTVPVPLVGAPLGPLNVGSTIFADAGASTRLKVPSILSLSYAQRLNDKWEMMADVTRTGWSSFRELRIDFATPQPDSVTTEDWKDVYRYALGGSYRMNNDWKLRAGVAFDESPVPNSRRRTPRVPDADRTWLSIGAGGVIAANWRLDVAYTHIFVKDTSIDNTLESALPQFRHILSGSYDSSVDILSAHVVWEL